VNAVGKVKPTKIHQVSAKQPALNARVGVYPSIHHLGHITDMDLRDSFSELKKKVKQRLVGKERKPDGKEAGADGEIVGPTSSLPRPEPHVVAGDGEGSGDNADERQSCPTDPPPQPEELGPVLVGRSENDQGVGGVDVDGREVSQNYPPLHSDFKVAMGSGPGRGDGVDEEERGGITNSVNSWLLQSLPLIILPDDTDNPVVLDRAPDIPCLDENIGPSTAVDGITSDGESTPSATVKLLCGVRDSLNGFGPLKSLARGLCLILENCKVWPPSCTFNLQCSQSFQQTEVDEQAIELLGPCIKVVSELLCGPIPPGDINEKDREIKLDRWACTVQGQ